MAYKSTFKPINKIKYIGKNINNIVCRSTWELGLAKYCDRNKDIVKWSLESVIIPYIDQLCKKKRKYYMDFFIEFSDGKRLLVEVKPFKQTQAPPGFNKNYKALSQIINENSNAIYDTALLKKYHAVVTYAKNRDKWNTTKLFAQEHGLTFQIWTEHTLKNLGIKIVSGQKPLKRQKQLRIKNKKKSINSRKQRTNKRNNTKRL